MKAPYTFESITAENGQCIATVVIWKDDVPVSRSELSFVDKGTVSKNKQVALSMLREQIERLLLTEPGSQDKQSEVLRELAEPLLIATKEHPI